FRHAADVLKSARRVSGMVSDAKMPDEIKSFAERDRVEDVGSRGGEPRKVCAKPGDLGKPCGRDVDRRDPGAETGECDAPSSVAATGIKRRLARKPLAGSSHQLEHSPHALIREGGVAQHHWPPR